MIRAFIADSVNRKRNDNTEQRIGVSVGVSATRSKKRKTKKEVLQSKGASAPPPAPSPMEEAQAQMELERERARLAEKETLRKEAIAQQEKEAKLAKASKLQGQAYDQALDFGYQQLGARGIDKALADQYQILGIYNTDMNNKRLQIAEDDINPFVSYNTRTGFEDALNAATGTYRNDLKKKLNSAAPDDFAYSAFADTADDDILRSILEEGKADALLQIDAAKARGQLNEQGYTKAMSGLDKQYTTGMADLQDIGLGVLSGYRDKLGKIRTDALASIGNAGLNDPYSFDTFNNTLERTKSDLMGRLKGDITRATSGKTWFDPATVISSAGALQGFYNPTATTGTTAGGANPLLNAFTTEEQKKASGTGSTTNGVF